MLQRWLNTPHVFEWWGEGKRWTALDVASKYETYVLGYKVESGSKKEINAYVIYIDDCPIGYIQSYNAYDFPRDPVIRSLPESLAALDFYIGDSNYLGKGLGSKVMSLFLQKNIFPCFDHCLVDPDRKNIRAIRSYEKAGFTKIEVVDEVVWMLASKLPTNTTCS